MKQALEQAANDYIGHEAEIDEGLEVGMQREAFKAGAQWRINSVWHTTADIPKTAKKSLVEYIDPDSGETTTRIDWRSEYEWVNACHYDKIIRWAYIDDLMPQPKEKGGEESE